MSENSLLTVPSMDGLHTNPMHVCARVCVYTVHIFSGVEEELFRKNAAAVMTD